MLMLIILLLHEQYTAIHTFPASTKPFHESVWVNTVVVKGYAEKVEVYADGRLIAAHARCFGKHQSVYGPGRCMPLLERRGRAILNVAPVLQNVPKNVLEQLSTNACDQRERIHILRQYCESPEPEALAVTDVIPVRPGDIRSYDALAAGRR